MMLETICITVALLFGLGFRYLGLPPLVGFLAAGFALNYGQSQFNLPANLQEILQHLAHLGVLMLLFTVGLKLQLKQVLKAEVVGGSLLHFFAIVPLLTVVVHYAFGIAWGTALFLAVSLGFSSTVLAAKLLETKRELSVFHGRTAIGILIIQDIIALAALAIFSGKTPNIGALGLLAIPVVRWGLHKAVHVAGHGELMVLTSMVLAVVVGGGGFTAMGLSSELGALVVGALLANHRKSGEIAASLLSMKDLFLVCFFLSIGMSGLPTLESLAFAGLFTVLLPLKAVLFFAVLVLFKLRARTAFLTSLSLMSYSEFGLIVAAGVAPEYLVPLGLTLAFSYVLSAPINRYAHDLFERWEPRLSRLQLDSFHPDEQPKDLADADVLIFGMGRTGSAAYSFLETAGFRPVGLDADTYKAEAHAKAGRKVFFGDAEDSQFWTLVDLKKIKATVLAMDDIEAKLIAVRKLKDRGFSGPIISHALHEDHQDRIQQAGATHTYLTMSQAGMGLAKSTVLALEAMAPKGGKPTAGTAMTKVLV